MGQIIVAIRLPPKAGLVCNKSLLFISISRPVQSAVNPVSSRLATLGASERPKAVAPKTPFLDVMSVSGSHPLTQLVQQLYEEQQEPFEEGRDVISSTDLFNWFKESKQIGKARVNDIVRALEVIGARPLGQCRFELHKKIIKPSLYVIRNHERYQHMSNQEIADKHYSPLRYANQNGII